MSGIDPAVAVVAIVLPRAATRCDQRRLQARAKTAASLVTSGAMRTAASLRRAFISLDALRVVVLLLAGCGGLNRTVDLPVRSLNVRVSSGGAGTGTIRSSDGKVNCSTCTTQYPLPLPAGTTITLTASPDTGSVFAGWGGDCSGTLMTCSISFSGNKIAIAFYRSTKKTIAVGAYHSCALLPSGTARCWGFNNDGEVDAAGAPGSLDVTTVPGFINAVSISAGGFHTCALLVGGRIRCWGRDSEGQLGKGSADKTSGVPSSVSGITDAIAVSAGGFHTCAIKATGDVLCWGSNSDGQLGIGSTNPSPDPQPVTMPPSREPGTAVSVSAGGFHTCAIRSDRTVWCWGRNSEGELGLNNTNPPAINVPQSPVLVGGAFGIGGAASSGLLSATSIAAAIGVGQQGLNQQGGFHTCAVASDGTAPCWGWNSNWQITGYNFCSLGSCLFPTAISVAVPYPFSDVRIPPPVLKVATGAYHSCILQSLGVFCWGDGQFGQNGDGSFGSGAAIVSGTAGATDIAAGGGHTCAVMPLTSLGRVACWGYNGFGEVTGSPTSQNVGQPFLLPQL